MDATLQTLKRFADPSQWDVVRDVPIFAVHKVIKRGADGQPEKIEVTEGDLKAIEQMARHQESVNGVCPRITLGHMKLPKDTPEPTQPAPIGFSRNLRVGRWGPKQKLGILCDQWFEKGKKPQPGDYPYRSVEYYPDTHEITGVALLRRDPELDLGIVTYERGTPCFCYSREDDMAEMNDPTKGNDGVEPTGQPDATAPDPEFQEHFMRCVRHNFPHLPSMHAAHQKQYAAGPGGPAPAIPSATNGSIPEAGAALKGEEEEAETYLRRNFPRVYARQQQERADASRKLLHYTRLQNEVELRQLVSDGYPIDLHAELQECADKDPKQFARYKQMLVRHYEDRRGPAQYSGIELPVSENGRMPAKLDDAGYDRAMQYMRDKNCSWTEAEKWALTNCTASVLDRQTA